MGRLVVRDKETEGQCFMLHAGSCMLDRQGSAIPKRHSKRQPSAQLTCRREKGRQGIVYRA